MQAYRGAPAEIAFLTQHQKQDTVGPILKDKLSMDVIHTDKFNTDELGTFDNKILRRLSAKQTALKKAYLACELSGLSAGIGSEGSFNSEFVLGIIDHEILAYVDIKQNIEIIAVAARPIKLSPFWARDEQQLLEKLSAFPAEQCWHVMASDHEHAELIAKGLTPGADLLACAKAQGFPLYLMPDFRAMNCPARQQIIALATDELAKRLSALCPDCGQPNFVFDQTLPGLPCELCMTPTALSKSTSAHCGSCGCCQVEAATESSASSFYCPVCNP